MWHDNPSVHVPCHAVEPSTHVYSQKSSPDSHFFLILRQDDESQSGMDGSFVEA